MLPMIGITLSLNEELDFKLHRSYLEAVLSSGGLPLMLPYVGGSDYSTEIIDKIQGLLITGGVDADPLLYGEEPLPALGKVLPDRDLWELKLIRLCLAYKKPILGICRGCQMLNIALGGTLYQDINTQVKNCLQHRQLAPRDHMSHTIYIKPDTLLKKIYVDDKARVNSFHHQSIKDIADPLCLSAHSADGIIEAVEAIPRGGKDSGSPFMLGVQWHPETMFANDHSTKRLFSEFIMACKQT